MDIATKENALVIGTGDLSELALGWCTYNGDHMSMYSVNCSVPKTLVKYLVEWVADNIAETDAKNVLYKIIATPISPELIPPDENGEIKQKTRITSYNVCYTKLLRGPRLLSLSWTHPMPLSGQL